MLKSYIEIINFIVKSRGIFAEKSRDFIQDDATDNDLFFRSRYDTKAFIKPQTSVSNCSCCFWLFKCGFQTALWCEIWHEIVKVWLWKIISSKVLWPSHSGQRNFYERQTFLKTYVARGPRMSFPCREKCKAWIPVWRSPSKPKKWITLSNFGGNNETAKWKSP